MANIIYLLWFVQEREGDADDTELLIGAFASRDEAMSAIAQLNSKPGFVTYPEGFRVDAYKLGKINWLEGFVET